MHFWGGVGWISALALFSLVGDRRGLLRTRARSTLERVAGASSGPDGRFNIGQKINALLTTAFAILFLVSGLLLGSASGTRASAWPAPCSSTTGCCTRRSSCSPVISICAVIHPATRHPLRGITRGTVSESWARRHYPRWFEPDGRTTTARRSRAVAGEGLVAEELGGAYPERDLDPLRLAVPRHGERDGVVRHGR